MAGVAHGLVPQFKPPLRRSAMSGSARAAGPPADEARLVGEAAAGDGNAFAELYRRYEQRAYNLCYRILGTEDDAADATQEAFVGVFKRLPKLQGRELAFGSYVFTSARNACYDVIDRRRRAEPSDQIPESSIPVGGGVGGGGFGFDPGDPEDDPERKLLLAAGQEEIRAANATLPERQREVLALRELEKFSYDEIAEIMDMNRNSVAQLISRARISLRDALRGTALASIASSSADCERALSLLAARQDRERAADGDRLTDHLLECETCRLSREAMEEAGVSYRAWLPIAAAPALFRETMASAAEAAGADWSDAIGRHEAAAHGAAGATAATEGARASAFRHRRLDALLIGLFALLLVVVVFAGATGDDTPPENAVPVADEAPAAAADEPDERRPKQEPAPAEQPTRKRSAHGDAPAAAPEPAEPAARDEPEDTTGAPSTPSNPVADGSPRTAPKGSDRGAGRRSGERGGGHGGNTGGSDTPGGSETPAVEPPPPPPPPQEPPILEGVPEPPAEEPRIEDPQPPPPPPARCRDAQGFPLPCGPTRPPQPPPRLAPPP
jgi:RNA polymerase sigma-70 factor, ECF subfamily